jgi:hypothetical protein
MLTKRLAVLACLIVSVGVSMVLASQWDGSRFRHLTARHVKGTVIVSAAGRRLTGFFDGMRPDPRWDAKRAAQAAQQIRKCESGGGLTARLLSLVQRTAYAQGSCSATGCFNNYQELDSYNCAPACGSYTNTVAGNVCNSGAYYTGTNGCAGVPGTCPGVCNVSTCMNGGCCTTDGSGCSENSDCCSNYCDLTTDTCQSEEVRRGGE